ncbi:MAG: hypothetical protein U9N34_04360, partial [Candidatus Cloacimonadota bacterium]|nr:hypothetical protein [Candidatus Cloacimonadota bacterium]
AYDREHQKYINSRDKVKASAIFNEVIKAWECLKDPAKRREYDEKLREERERGLTREGDPKLEIADESGQEKRSFYFRNMRLGATSSVTLTVKNGGGGTLDAKIKTNRSWLIVDTKGIHQSKLPQRIKITVDPRKDKSKNSFASEDEGVIEISYQRGSYIESERISVAFSIEVPDAALKRFIIVMIPPIAIIGGLVGLIVGLPLPNSSVVVDVFNLLNLLIMILAAIAIPIFFGIMAKEGYKFVIGCGTYIGICVILAGLFSLFELENTPTLLAFIFNGGLFFSLIFLGLSKKLFPYKKNIITKAWVTAGAILLVGILIVILAEQWQAKLGKMDDMESAIQEIRTKLPGEWHGRVGTSLVALFISKESGKLSGKMVYSVFGGIEEEFSIDFKDFKNKDGQVIIVLKGIRQKSLKGKTQLNLGKLNTLYGTLSSGGDILKGYVDKSKYELTWCVGRGVAK